MVLGIIINLVLSLWVIPEYLGRKREIGFTWSLVACLFLTPILGVIITLFSPKLEEYKKGNRDSEVKKREDGSRYNDNREKLKNLKEKGILNEQEYNQKVEALEITELELEVKNSDDYKALKELFEDGILTKEEFDEKLETLRLKFNNLRQKEKIGFTITEEISEGYFVIRDDDFNYGYADQQMNKVIDTVYDHAESFKEGIALVRYNGKFGFINKKNEAVIPCLYDNADSFKGGVAKVRKGKEVFYINIKGERQL